MHWRNHNGLRFLEAELPGAQATFTTRIGGVSEEPFATLNVGLVTGDAPASVRENRRRIAAAAAVDPRRVLMGRQVHGAELEVREAPPEPNAYVGPAPPPDPADGQVTSRTGLAPLVQVADCLPVALSGPGGVAMLHCGWRGLAAGIVARGVDAVDAQAAAVGPGIGPCCYEVGDEVLHSFSGLGPGIHSGRMLDLRAVAGRLLERACVGEVEVSELCTSCHPELFFSHRRDGARTGRQAALVQIVGSA